MKTKKAPTKVRASWDLFSEPLLAASIHDWAGAQRRPSFSCGLTRF
jgi:hypothetical protein